MNAHGLDRIFKPQRIALIGVTENPKSVGGTVLRNIVGSGFHGVVYPVNPSAEAVLGVPCYPDVRQLPRVPDVAVICAAASAVPDLVRDCGETGIRGLVILSAGFRETGAEGRALEERILAERRRFDGMRILGPNCLGIIVPSSNLNLTFASGTPKPGRVAFVSQSGALCTSVLDWALDRGIGFSHFVSIGNMIDVSFGDLIDYFGEDEKTDSVILYVESIRLARRFMTAARAFARSKPIVAYKAGRFPESAQAAASHTGALASEDAVFDAAFERAGIVRVHEIGDIFSVAELVGRRKTPAGPRLAIVTNAGGPGVMATDALIARQGVLARLSDETLGALDECLPPFWSRNNPVDVLGDARSKRFAKAVDIVLGDRGVDAVLAILTPQAMTNPTATAKEVAAIAGRARKPVLAAWLGGRSMRDGIAALSAAGVPSFETPEEGVKAFMTLVSYARNLEILYETPRDVPVGFTVHRAELRERFPSLLPESGDILSESSSKEMLEAYGIPITRPELARTADEAVAIARRLGDRVALKIESPEITHKTDVGGVVLDVEGEAAVRAAYERIVESVRARAEGASIVGVTVQPMVAHGAVTEVIVGAKRDPAFGSVILFGLGGISAEIFQDTALGFPPLNERLARRMIESLRAWPLLRGYRGKPGVSLDALVQLLMRLSYLVADYPEIRELDVNPVLVSAEDAVAVDARVVIDRSRIGRPHRDYDHLVLRPYPEEYVSPVVLKDGTELLFRPIRPEDEPSWKALLASCSPESLYARFRYLFQWSSHEVATRYCFIDYDREIAIVAERNDGPERRLVAVGRLIADPSYETVEYAILISDDYQNRGLGGVLTDACLEIAQRWKPDRIVATTTSDNARMLALFEERGFSLSYEEDGLVECSKILRQADRPAM